MDERKIIEALDCCRPASGDPTADLEAEIRLELANDPRSEPLRRRIGKWDHAIRAVLTDVPVPDGLADRLLANLPADADSAGVEVAVNPVAADRLIDGKPTAATDITFAARNSGAGKVSRRGWGIFVSVATAAAVMLAGVVWLISGDTSEDWSPSALAERGWQEFQDFDLLAEPLVTDRPPTELAMSRKLQPRASGWRRVRDWLGHQGVVYQLNAVGRAQGWLFVLDAPSESLVSLPERPPLGLDYETAGLGCAVWQENGKLCMLVIEGDPNSYEHFIQSDRLA